MNRVKRASLLCAAIFSLLALGLAAPSGMGQGPEHVTSTQQTTRSASLENWWENAVIYQIYPRSFQDSNGDGIGDLNGITSRLDYLQKLGVDAIWLNPIYPSPQVDFGYDISDYEAIDPQYGGMADFDRLMAEAKKRNIRVVMDMVMNHSSDQHKWFLESRSSRDNSKRDWYVWKHGKGQTATDKGQPPNNWQSYFGHSAWEWDEKTRQYYYHKFYIQQPDFNWNNPAVSDAFDRIVRFWMKKGVAGFRLDAITTLFEDPNWIDDVELKDKNGKSYLNAYGDVAIDDARTNNLPQVHDVLVHLRKVTDSIPSKTFPGRRVLIGETYLKTIGDLNRMYGTPDKPELQLPMDTQVGFVDKLDVAAFRTKLNDVQTKIDGNIPLLVFDNHDNPRIDARYGDGIHDNDITRVISTILFASRGASLFYYGAEIGMKTTPPTRKEDVKDPIGITGWPKEKGRDGERTPMQWDNSMHAGFSTATPWLPVPPSKSTINVKSEMADPNSLLNWYKSLIKLKKTNPAFVHGDNIMLDTDNTKVLSWLRVVKAQGPVGHAVVVATNFTAEPQQVRLNLFDAGVKTKRLKTLLETPQKSSQPPMAYVETDSSGRIENFAREFMISLPPFGVYIGEVE